MSLRVSVGGRAAIYHLRHCLDRETAARWDYNRSAGSVRLCSCGSRISHAAVSEAAVIHPCYRLHGEQPAPACCYVFCGDMKDLFFFNLFRTDKSQHINPSLQYNCQAPRSPMTDGDPAGKLRTCFISVSPSKTHSLQPGSSR